VPNDLSQGVIGAVWFFSTGGKLLQCGNFDFEMATVSVCLILLGSLQRDIPPPEGCVSAISENLFAVIGKSLGNCKI